MIILPRQARDRHRENSKKEWGCSALDRGVELRIGSAIPADDDGDGDGEQEEEVGILSTDLHTIDSIR